MGEAGVFEGFLAGDDGVLSVGVGWGWLKSMKGVKGTPQHTHTPSLPTYLDHVIHAARILFVDVDSRVKVPNLARKLGGKVGRVPPFDCFHPRLSRQQGAVKGVRVVPQAGDDAHARDDDAAGRVGGRAAGRGGGRGGDRRAAGGDGSDGL